MRYYSKKSGNTQPMIECCRLKNSIRLKSDIPSSDGWSLYSKLFFQAVFPADHFVLFIVFVEPK
jgi:hypothetical protein